jgi:alkylation response protein AidB-like acyl-CoA dehydrogenase
MFLICVMHLADEEQLKYWMPLIKESRIAGCYAQTELGHGSNVAVRNPLFSCNPL